MMLGAPPRAHAASLATREIITRAAAARTLRDIFISVSSEADIGLAVFKGKLGAETLRRRRIWPQRRETPPAGLDAGRTARRPARVIPDQSPHRNVHNAI